MLPSNSNAIDDPQTLLEHATEKAPIMRNHLSRSILTNAAGATDYIMSEPVLVTYFAFSLCHYLPGSKALVDEYLSRGFDLTWILGLQIRTPGPLLEHPPLHDNLVLSLDALPPVRASLLLRRTQARLATL